MRSKPQWLFVALCLLSASCFAQVPADVGIVTFVSGEVSLHSALGDESVPKPFSRIRANERLTLRPGARLRILYLQSGNSELWNGPAEFSVGSGTRNSVSQPAQVQPLPVKARAKLQLALRLSNNEQLGGSTVRGLRPKHAAGAALDAAQLAEIRDMYHQLRREFPDNDITAEVFLSMSMQAVLSGNP